MPTRNTKDGINDEDKWKNKGGGYQNTTGGLAASEFNVTKPGTKPKPAAAKKPELEVRDASAAEVVAERDTKAKSSLERLRSLKAKRRSQTLDDSVQIVRSLRDAIAAYLATFSLLNRISNRQSVFFHPRIGKTIASSGTSDCESKYGGACLGANKHDPTP